MFPSDELINGSLFGRSPAEPAPFASSDLTFTGIVFTPHQPAVLPSVAAALFRSLQNGLAYSAPQVGKDEGSHF